MVEIEAWFPIYIGVAHNPFHKEVEDELTQECLKIKKSYKKEFEEFRLGPTAVAASSSPLLDWYQFQGTTPYYLLEDQKFNRLHKWIDDQVGEYTEKLQFLRKLRCSEGWFNVYEKYEFTDYHNHAPFALSCVYFLNSDAEAGAKLLIKNNHDDLVAYSPITLSYMYNSPVPGKLIIFSSYLEHGVQQHNTDDLRITLSYNYI